MTTAYTSLLGLALPVTGELSGTWGDTVNNSITSLVDSAVAGTTNVSTDADVTLTTTTGAANTAREAILLFSGARTAQRTVTAPAQSKVYTVINATTGGYAVKLVGAGPTTGLTIPNGASATVAWNGSDFVEIGTSSIGNLTVNGNLTVTGNTVLGDASTDTLNVANGNLILNSSGNLGLGVTPSAWYSGNSAKVFEFGSAGNAILQYGSTSNITSYYLNNAYLNTSASFIYGQTGGGASSYRQNNGTHAWSIAPSGTAGNAITFTQAMTLDASGNLGIGTSSPTRRLDVRQAYTTDTIVAQIGNTNNGNGSTPVATIFDFTEANGTSVSRISSIYTQSTGKTDLAFGTYNGGLAERMRLDSSGNLGLGTTPANWGSGWAAMQVAGYYAAFGASVTGAVEAFMVSNAYYNGGWRGGLTGSNSTLYEQFGGQHRWYVASSVTAGSIFSYTQAMTMDNSGNLGIGTTAPSSALHVEVPNATAYDSTNTLVSGQTARISNENTTAGISANLLFVAKGSGGGNGLGSISGVNTGTGSLALTFATRNSSSNVTERARITETGSLLVGTTSSSGSISNFQPVYAGAFKTAQGSISTTSGVAATLFTAPGSFSSYFVTVWINADDVINYQAVLSINTQPNGAIKLNTIVSANLFTFSLSGYNVQVTQLSGGTATVNYTATRIAG